MIRAANASSTQAVLQASGKRSVTQKVVEEAKKFYIIAGYLWIAFFLLELHRLVIVRELNVTSLAGFRTGFALINALVLGKIILLTEHLHLAEQFLNKRRLVFLILFRSAVFGAVLLFFQVLEDVTVGIWHGKTFVQSIPQLGGGGLEGMLIVGTMMSVFLIPFIAFIEVQRVMGENEVHSLIFGKRSSR